MNALKDICFKAFLFIIPISIGLLLCYIFLGVPIGDLIKFPLALVLGVVMGLTGSALILLSLMVVPIIYLILKWIGEKYNE